MYSLWSSDSLSPSVLYVDAFIMCLASFDVRENVHVNVAKISIFFICSAHVIIMHIKNVIHLIKTKMWYFRTKTILVESFGIKK